MKNDLLPGLFFALILSVSLGFSTLFADPYITYKNTFLFGWVAVFLSLFLAFPRRDDFRYVPYGFWVILGLVGHAFFIATSSHRPYNATALALDSALVVMPLAWIRLMEIGGNAYRRVIAWNGLCSLLVALIGLAQLMGVETPMLPEGQGAISTLANINMVAQYLICSIALVLASGTETQGWKRWGGILLASVLASYIALILCRSTIIGFVLLMGYLLLFRLYRKREIAALLLSTVAVVALVHAFSGAQGSGTFAEEVLIHKAQNSSGRIFLWLQSWDLIKDYAWTGVGRGNFEMLSSPYMLSKPSQFAAEGMVVDAPHNEVIQIIAEFGLPLGLLLLAAAAVILLPTFYRHIKNGEARQGKVVPCLALGLVLLPEFLFQFPLKMPFSIPFIGLFIALFYQTYPKNAESRPLRFPIIANLGAAVLAFFFAWQALRYFQAEKTFHDPQAGAEDLQQACEKVPENWRVCLRAQYERLGQGQATEVLAYAEDYLVAHPGFYLVERLRIEAALRHEPLNQECEAVIQYKKKFHGTTSLDRHAEWCTAISSR